MQRLYPQITGIPPRRLGIRRPSRLAIEPDASRSGVAGALTPCPDRLPGAGDRHLAVVPIDLGEPGRRLVRGAAAGVGDVDGSGPRRAAIRRRNVVDVPGIDV